MVKSHTLKMSIGGIVCLVGMTACGRPELEACDIRQEDCFTEIFLAVQDVRGTGWDPWQEPPPRRIITEQDFQAELVDGADEKPSPELQAWERALQALGLVARNTGFGEASTESSTDFVAAYYSKVDRSITIIDRGDSDDRSDTLVLAHELTHAAQDREYDLNAYEEQAKSFADFTRQRTIIEGDAELVETLIFLRLEKANADDYDWDSYHQRYLASVWDYISASESPFFSVPALFYPLGSRWMFHRWLASGSVGAQDAWQGEAPSAAELMAGVPGGAPGVARTCQRTAPPEGFEPILDEEMGPYYGFAFLTSWSDAFVGDVWNQAKQWQDDLLAMHYSPASGDVFANWTIRFSDNATAVAVSETLNAAGDPFMESAVFDEHVVVVASDPPALKSEHPPACP